MIREFVITEVMLDGVAGEVRGRVAVNPWTGEIESVDFQLLDFRCDVTDEPISLSPAQTESARQIAERTLAAESELSDSGDRYQASAAHLETPPPAVMSESQKVLADYLEHIRRAESSTESVSEQSLPFRRLG